MKSFLEGSSYILRFEKDELVMEQLRAFVMKENIKGAWVSGLGGLTWAELGFYDLTAQAYLWTKLEEPLELLNLTGNIALADNEPFLHIHATVSDASQYARGGHLNEAAVAGTVELHLQLIGGSKGLKRSLDTKTGLKLFDS